jgi:membrane protease YdiL (CAAX protease family)
MSDIPSAVESGSGAFRQRMIAAMQLAVMGVLTPLLITSISPVAAVKGDLLVKLLFIGRMVVLIAAATLLLRLSGRRWADVGLRKVKPSRFFLAIPLGLAAAYAVPLAGNVIVTRLGLEGKAVDYTFFTLIRGNLEVYLFLLIPASWGTAAFGEEMLMRGFFLDAFQRMFGSSGPTGTTIAVIAQAVVFGVFHLYQGPAQAVAAGAIGLVLGFVWWFSGRNLWAGIVLHGILDSISMTGLYLGLIGPPG